MGHLETNPQETDESPTPFPFLLLHLYQDGLKYIHSSVLHTTQSSFYLYRKGPTRDGDHRAAVEVVGEFVAVHCGAHQDELQV